MEKILQEVDQLTTEEVAELINRLQVRLKTSTSHRRRWAEIAGKAPYPLTGEDAQTWVSRTRREADLQRQTKLGSVDEHP
ncbi:MAG: hypothetical protein NZ520_10650 [bacterium]|nr:hypothetical protein [bacterium]